MADTVKLDTLLDDGVYAYKSREYKEAISQLQQVLDLEPRHWRAKLYLAMSYYQSGDLFQASRHFNFLKDNCVDAEIKTKAEAALVALNQQIAANAAAANSRMPEMTCTMKKPQVFKPEEIDEENPEIEWVDTRPNK